MNTITHLTPIDQSRLFLVKGRKVGVCHSCKSSFLRVMLVRCEHCNHPVCRSCEGHSRCSSKSLRLSFAFWKRTSAAEIPSRTLALVR